MSTDYSPRKIVCECVQGFLLACLKMQHLTVALMLFVACSSISAQFVPPSNDCRSVRCFGACQPGTCSPKPGGECCDNLGKCTSGGCCGDKCQNDRDCKAGPCGVCSDGVCSGPGNEGQCAAVSCFAACRPGTCSPRPNGQCCDDLGQCSAGGCCGDRCRRNRDCKAGPCSKCRRGRCRGKRNSKPDPPPPRPTLPTSRPPPLPTIFPKPKEDCRKVLCFAACPPGECAPRPNGECCDSIDKCSRGGCCGDRCRSNRDCKAGPCGKCVRRGWGRRGVCGGGGQSGEIIF